MPNKPISPREPDYKISVTIKKDAYFREGIRCDVYLPRRVTGPIFLYMYPTPEEMNDLPRLFGFSVYGQIKDVAGDIIGTICANRVYSESSKPNIWEKTITGWEVPAEPEDFTVTHILKRPKRASRIVRGAFWLTPCVLLSPQKVVTRYPSGKVIIKTLHKLAFELPNGTELIFDKHFNNRTNEDGDEVVFQELVAEFKLSTSRTQIQETLLLLDDLLLLVSCAARQKCVCIGYDSIESGYWKRFYRKDLVLPEDSKINMSHGNTLIHGYEFEEFIKVAYGNLLEIKDKVLIRQVMYALCPSHERTFEAEFLVLYAAIESLVLLFRRGHGMEFVLPRDDWKLLKQRMKETIKKHPKCGDNAIRRLLYENLEGLNHVSFPTAFEECCKLLSVSLDDLWPIIHNTDGVSLSKIRNKLVHGDILSDNSALLTAGDHLRWILERLFLGILGWPTQRSTVHSETLKKFTAYQEWQNDRNIVSGTF